MSLLNPAVLWHLLWLIPLILVLYWIGSVRAAAFLHRAGKISKYSELSGPKRFLRMLLLCGTVFFLAAAAARPAWGERFLPEPPLGRDIMVMLDISRSMLSDNVRPSRLEHAKMVLRRIAESLPGDRFGLIAFAGNAQLVCPMTADTAAFLNKLSSLTPESAKRGGTNLERALETALLALNGGASAKNRAVLLLSDGGELEGNSKQVLDEYKKEKIPVFTMGIGEKNTPALIPLAPSVLLKDRAGNTVHAPLDEAALRTIAQKTGGLYFQSTTLQDGVAILAQDLRSKLTPEAGTSMTDRIQKVEHPAIPLAASLICFSLFCLISERRKLLTALLFLSATVWIYGQEQEMENPALTAYRQGVALHKEGKTEEAAEQYEHAVTAGENDLQIRTKSYLNLGVLEHSAGRAAAMEAEQKVQEQNLDQAVGLLDQALEKLKTAEEDYRESLRAVPGENKNPDEETTVQNQTILLRDRKQMEQRRKEIEELKKQQKQAQQSAQNAMNNQKEQNTEQAQQDAQDLSGKAQNAGQKQMAQQAADAAKDLQDAKEKQKQGDQKSAEQSIRDAMRKLGLDPDQKQNEQDQQNQGQQNQGQQNQDGQSGQPDQQNQDGQNGKTEQPQNKTEPDQNKESSATAKPDRETDEKGSDQLEMMRRANEDFRNDLEKRRAEAGGIMPVEKDW